MSSRLAVGKTYESKTKKDTSSALFDDILSSTRAEAPSHPRRSPRKLNPHPVKGSKEKVPSLLSHPQMRAEAPSQPRRSPRKLNPHPVKGSKEKVPSLLSHPQMRAEAPSQPRRSPRKLNPYPVKGSKEKVPSLLSHPQMRAEAPSQPRRSPRKLNPHPVKGNKEKVPSLLSHPQMRAEAPSQPRRSPRKLNPHPVKGSKEKVPSLLSHPQMRAEAPSQPRRSPRKLNPHPVKGNKEKAEGEDDVFAFSDSSPPGTSPEPPSGLKGGLGKRKASPLSPPAIIPGFEPEGDSDDEEEGSSSQASSQGSVSSGLKAVRLTSPNLSPPTSMPPPKSPPLRIPAMVKSRSAPVKPVTDCEAAGPKPGPRKGVYSWRKGSDSDEEDEFEFPEEPQKPAPPKPVQMVAGGSRGALSGRGSLRGRPVPPRRPWAAETAAPIRSVKDAHQIHDHGEVAEHKGDVDYLLSSLKESSSAEVRILSMLQLARKALNSAFRQFLRSKGLLPVLFRGLLPHLADSPTLCLPSSLILYLLSRDRLGFPPDDDSLRLALALLKAPLPPNPTPPSHYKCKDKVWEILEQWRRACEQTSTEFSFDVTRENLSPRFLTTEALVYISLRSTEPKQKEALLNLGILQHTAQSLADNCSTLATQDVALTPQTREQLKLIERYLRILENATSMQANQTFLVTYRNSLVINACGKLMRFFHSAMELLPVQNGDEEAEGSADHRLIHSTLSSYVRLLCNMANNHELCCMRLGQIPNFLNLTLSLLTHSCPERLPRSKVFDTQFMVISLLINLVEHCNANRRLLLSMRTRVVFGAAGVEELGCLAALTRLFAFHSGRAVAVEAEVDRKLEVGAAAAVAKAGTQRMASEAALQATVDEAMSNAGAHMEEGIMAAYLALFLGFLVLQNEYVVPDVRELLPDGKFQPMVKAMQQLSDFMELTDSINKSGQLAIAKVIELFEKFDRDT